MSNRKPKPSPTTQDLINRLAELEGITASAMQKKMVEFYGMAVSFLYEEGMTPIALAKFIVGIRHAIIEQGMQAVAQALHAEDHSAAAPPTQRLGKRKFVMPGPTEVIAEELTPTPPAPPEPAQRKIG